MEAHKAKSESTAVERSGRDFMPIRLTLAIRVLFLDGMNGKKPSASTKVILSGLVSLILRINITILFFTPISFCVLHAFDPTLVFNSNSLALLFISIILLYIVDILLSKHNHSTFALFLSDHATNVFKGFTGIAVFNRPNIDSRFVAATILINLVSIPLSEGSFFIKAWAVANIFILSLSYFIVQKTKSMRHPATEKKRHVVWVVLSALLECMFIFFIFNIIAVSVPLTEPFSGRDINSIFQLALTINGLCFLFPFFIKQAYSFFKWIRNRISIKNFSLNVLVFFAAISCSVVYACSFLALLLQISLAGAGIIKCVEYISFNFVTTYAFLSLLLFAFLFFFTKSASLKYISFNLIFILSVVIVVEKYLFEKHRKSPTIPVKLLDTPGTVLANQEIFGYGPVKNSVDHVEAYALDTLVWKQTYTIDSNGQRITPEYTPNKKDDKSILFFGCSMTFGHGLRDEGAYPYKVGQLLKDKFKVYNFAYGGYGTHQALSMLEHNLTDSIVEYEPKYIFYAALPEHVNRAIDLYHWGHDGPKFILDENNKVKFVGYFNKVPLTLYEKFRNKFFESEIFLEIHGREGWTRDVDLFIAMIDRMQEIIKKKYPACEFHILYWESDWAGGHQGLDKKVMSRLKEKEKDWHIHYMRDIIPGYGKNRKTQVIHPLYDAHQKEFVNDTIANYVVKKIIKDGK